MGASALWGDNTPITGQEVLCPQRSQRSLQVRAPRFERESYDILGLTSLHPNSWLDEKRGITFSPRSLNIRYEHPEGTPTLVC